MKKVMILGAGSCQLNAIKKIKKMGHIPIVSDYLIDSPGKRMSKYTVLADTFSYEQTLDGAVCHDINGIMTTGTDQPVWTVSKVAETLNLYSFLTEDQALAVTNKKVMKERFKHIDVPTVDYQIINKESIINIEPPFVMKPLDSQGQRGIYKLSSIEEVFKYIDNTLSYSKLDEVLLEKYYENKEVTVSGWVKDGDVTILTITDRVTFNSDEHIGVCISHEYPTIHQAYVKELKEYTTSICKGFMIKDGPIYFQYLIGEDGVKVNEIACRIGGAYEDLTIPLVTNVDILEMQIKACLNEPYNLKYSKNNIIFSTQLLFCKPGYITQISSIESLIKESFILDVGFNYKKGNTIMKIENASQRAGYMIVTGKDEETLAMNISKAYDLLYIKDEEENLVIRGKRYYR